MRFEDKVVIVTGASSGIGEGVAKKFLAEGAYVVGCGIEPAMKIQDEKAIYVQADLTKPEQALHVVEEAIKTYGRVNKLVCCWMASRVSPRRPISAPRFLPSRITL